MAKTMLLWETWGLYSSGFSNCGKNGEFHLILPLINLWRPPYWRLMLVSVFDKIFLSSWESIFPAQNLQFQWFIEGVCPPNFKFDGLRPAVWRSVSISIEQIITPAWPPPLKMVLFYEPFTGLLYSPATNPSSLAKLFGLLTYGCIGWTVRPKFARSKEELSTASRLWLEFLRLFSNNKMRLWNISDTLADLCWQIILIVPFFFHALKKAQYEWQCYSRVLNSGWWWLLLCLLVCFGRNHVEHGKIDGVRDKSRSIQRFFYHQIRWYGGLININIEQEIKFL